MTTRGLNGAGVQEPFYKGILYFKIHALFVETE